MEVLNKVNRRTAPSLKHQRLEKPIVSIREQIVSINRTNNKHKFKCSNTDNEVET